ncbi:MAG: six-hairpin glycosidase, partial [Rikenellaceae bacterium]|nr:six-hairpin glycosidase [Rikenellaceae bacterium]
MKNSRIFCLAALLALAAGSLAAQQPAVLKTADYKRYVDYFNRMEEPNITNAISNEEAWNWMERNIPLFDCPQDNFREIYYFRWWSFRKHIIDTPTGRVVSEFLVSRPHADNYNMIACAIGHHVYEMRWLHDKTLLEEYLNVWYTGNDGGPMSKLHAFSSWAPDALWNAYLVNNDRDFLTYMYPLLKADYARWEREKRLSDGLFWQRDVSDGMEESASGGRNVQNKRPTINSYMYGNATALSKTAALMGNNTDAAYFLRKADTLKNLIQAKLWNDEEKFFESFQQGDTLAKVREAIGFIPWYFNLPDGGKYDAAWLQFDDRRGFNAPFGL